jgi:hypothetical protein
VRLSPGPQGPSRRRVRGLNAALVLAAVLVWAAGRARRVVIGDLERQPVDAPARERLPTPPELD